MSPARLVITAVILEGRSQVEVANSYGVSEAWVSMLLARYREQGELAFEPRSKRPKSSPGAISSEVVARIVELRGSLVAEGLDAGATSIAWHLRNHDDVVVS